MTTSPTTSQFPNFIDPQSLIFNEPEINYSPIAIVDGGLAISHRYRHLDRSKQETILDLWEAGHQSAACTLADCGRYGSVHKRCKKKNRAQAHRHTCHLWVEPYCGRPHNLLRCWLRWRSSEVREAKQWGIEIHGPLGYDLWKRAAKIGRWLKDQGISCTMRPVLSPKPRSESVRIVYRRDRSIFGEVTAYLHKITKNLPGYSAATFYDSSSTKVLEWMFSSHIAILESCGHNRAKFYIQWYRKQMTKTYGDFYKEVEEEQDLTGYIEEGEGSRRTDITCDCGECDGEMEVIPWNERHTQSVDEIQKEYQHVDWTSCYDPFHDRRNSHKQHLMAESTGAQGQAPMLAASPPS